MPTIRRDFGDLYVRAFGADAETVILLHEYFGTHQSWAAQSTTLARHFRVLVPDIRGHGRSTMPRDGRISVSGIADDVRAIRDRHDTGPCHLIGCSLGAVAAMNLALNEPGSVRSLTIAGVPSLTSTDATSYARGYIDRVFPGIEASLDGIHGDGQPGYSRSLLLRNFALDLEVQPEDFTRSTDHVGDIVAPTLVVSGESDPVFAPRTALGMAERMANASLAVLPACGHLVHQDMPGVFNSLVFDHLIRSMRDGGLDSG